MSQAVRINSTGRKLFARARPRQPTRSPARVTRSSTTRPSKTLAAAAARRGLQRRRAGEVPEVQGSPHRRRRLHPLEGEFARYLEDVYSDPPIPREALDDDCEILVIGAGFGALLLWYRLMKAGFTDVRFCEKGGDVGGTWYWNRYPGIACDVESYSYLPLLEEMGHIPSMKFASGFEILEYCQVMAERFGFYDRCLFHTTVEETQWDEARPLDRAHGSRRCHARALCGARQRHSHHAEARSHQGHGNIQGRGVPYLALELSRRPARASASASSALARRPCRPFPSWPRL